MGFSVTNVYTDNSYRHADSGGSRNTSSDINNNFICSFTWVLNLGLLP